MSTTDLIMWILLLAAVVLIVQMYTDFIKWILQNEQRQLDFTVVAGSGAFCGLILIAGLISSTLYLTSR